MEKIKLKISGMRCKASIKSPLKRHRMCFMTKLSVKSTLAVLIKNNQKYKHTPTLLTILS